MLHLGIGGTVSKEEILMCPNVCHKIYQMQERKLLTQGVLIHYKQLKEIYEKFDLLKYPQLIYNGDETELSSVSDSSSNVLAQKGLEMFIKFSPASEVI